MKEYKKQKARKLFEASLKIDEKAKDKEKKIKKMQDTKIEEFEIKRLKEEAVFLRTIADSYEDDLITDEELDGLGEI